MKVDRHLQGKILSVVVRNFRDKTQATSRVDLILEFEGEDTAEAIGDLLNRSIVLRKQNAHPEEYLPTAMAFEFCDDQKLKQEARESVRLLLHTFKRMFKANPKGQWTPEDALKNYAEANPNIPIKPSDFELALYLVSDLHVLGGRQLNSPDDTRVTWFQISECIITKFKNLDSAWDETMKWHKPDAYGHVPYVYETSPIAIVADGAGDHTQVYLPSGSQHDAYREMRKIVQLAKAEIVVVDNYVDHTLWELLTNVESKVKIRILTEKMQGDFRLEAKKFCAQHGNTIEVKTTKTCHDRFIIADGLRCWHIGASIKDAGSKAFAFSEFVGKKLSQFAIKDVEASGRRRLSWHCRCMLLNRFPTGCHNLSERLSNQKGLRRRREAADRNQLR